VKKRKPLLYEEIVLRTKLTEEQIVDRLEESIDDSIKPKSLLGIFGYPFAYSKPYFGVIQGRTFRARRVFYFSFYTFIFPFCYLYPFLPILTGKIFERPIETNIYIEMRPQRLAILFMIIVLVGFAFFTFLIILYKNDILINGVFSPFLLIPLAMLTNSFFYPLWAYKFFKNESKKSKMDFLEIFEAEIEE